MVMSCWTARALLRSSTEVSASSSAKDVGEPRVDDSIERSCAFSTSTLRLALLALAVTSSVFWSLPEKGARTPNHQERILICFPSARVDARSPHSSPFSLTHADWVPGSSLRGMR